MKSCEKISFNQNNSSKSRMIYHSVLFWTLFPSFKVIMPEEYNSGIICTTKHGWEYITSRLSSEAKLDVAIAIMGHTRLNREGGGRGVE